MFVRCLVLAAALASLAAPSLSTASAETYSATTSQGPESFKSFCGATGGGGTFSSHPDTGAYQCEWPNGSWTVCNKENKCLSRSPKIANPPTTPPTKPATVGAIKNAPLTNVRR